MATSERTGIWQCRVSDGVTQYFVDRSEAEFFAKDTVECGFTVMTHFIPLPRDQREFVAFMESLRGEVVAKSAA